MMFLIQLIAILVTAAMTWIGYLSIQQGQWLGAWQKVLYKWDMKGWQIVKPLGLCQLCFSHLCAFIGWWLYVIVCYGYFGLWFEKWVWFMSFISYLTFISLTTLLSTYILNRLFK